MAQAQEAVTINLINGTHFILAYSSKVFLKKGAPLLEALVPAHLNNLVAATVRTMGHGHFDKVIKEIQQVHSAHQPALSLWWRFVGSIGPKALT